MTLPEEQIRADERVGMVKLFTEVERLHADGALPAVIVNRVLAYVGEHMTPSETAVTVTPRERPDLLDVPLDAANLDEAVERLLIRWGLPSYGYDDGADRADLADAIARLVLEWQARDSEPSVPVPPATLGEALDGMADEEPF